MPKPTAKEIRAALRSLADPGIAEHSQRFFKTGPGEYGEGDRFLGLRVPEVRRIARQFREASLPTCLQLLRSPFHEERLWAVIFLTEAFKRADAGAREQIYHAYSNNLSHVNNWDIVDISAPHIAGGWLQDKDRSPLHRWARSANLWERRIAIIATHHFIRRNDFCDTFALGDMLLHDREDLIHKAVGWMLREVGNRDRGAEEEFLQPRYRHMPRIMLRYAIEKFPEDRRRAFLQGKA